MLISVPKGRLYATQIVVCCLFTLIGCTKPKQDDPREVVQVSGKVVYKGQPVVGAQLTFHRETGGESAFGMTDAQGKFVGMTNDTTGLFPGEYLVTITHPSMALPKKCADMKLTPLNVSVLSDEAQQDFPLRLGD